MTYFINRHFLRKPVRNSVFECVCLLGILRAISYAMSKGVAVITAAGNNNRDLDHPTTDDTSPNNGNPFVRNVTLNCPQVRLSTSAQVCSRIIFIVLINTVHYSYITL